MRQSNTSPLNPLITIVKLERLFGMFSCLSFLFLLPIRPADKVTSVNRNDSSEAFFLSSSSTSSQNYDVAIPIDETDDDQLLSLLIKQANLSIIQTFKPTSHPKVREREF